MCATIRGLLEIVSYSIHRISPATYRSLTPRLVDIYLAAMDYNPAIRPARITAWRAMSDEPGFRCVVARDNATGTPIGLAMGRPGRPHHWWQQQVRLGSVEAPWSDTGDGCPLADYFEIAEIHVAPSWQGRGAGRKLLSTLLDGVGNRWALLSTPEVPGENNPAFSLYRSMGFSDVLRHFRFSGDSRPFAVLGTGLPPKQTETETPSGAAR